MPANDLTIIDTSGVTFPGGGGGLNTAVLQSIVSTNPNPSSGGRNGDTSDEIRQNALYSYSTQLRAVTKDDYIVRALSMPSEYGVVSKAYISQDLYSNPQQTTTTLQQNNPLSLDLYILSYNNSKQLTPAPITLKQNLVTYLNQYYDPYIGGSINYQGATENFGWASYSPGLNFVLFPIYWDRIMFSL